MPTTAKATRKAKATRDIFDLLTADHEKVAKLFRKFERADEAEQSDIASTICMELTIHAQLEEELFYPALREAIKKVDLLDEAEVEHGSLKQLIADIEEMETGDQLYAAKVKVLGEYVNHHVEEEENEIFKEARKAKIDAEGIAEEFLTRKTELLAQMGADVDMAENEEDDEAPRKKSAPRRTNSKSHAVTSDLR